MSKPESPYVGPRAFEAGELLFGREREVRELVAMLIADRIVLLLSPSGAGKTSLIQARLIQALKDEELQVLPVLRVSTEPRPDEKEAVRGVNRYLLGAFLSRDPDRQTPLTDVVGLTFQEVFRQRSEPSDGGSPQVVIFDQFEEIITLDPTDQEAKEVFFEQVGSALRNRQRWAVFSMREDYVGALEPYVSRIPTRLRTMYRLDLLSEGAARLAIQAPARRRGVEFKDSATNRVIDDLRTMQVQRPDGTIEEKLGLYIEPVQLQVVCSRLWERLPDGATAIDESLVDARGGDVDAALADYYADRVNAIAGGDLGKERHIRTWFEEHLITEFGTRGHVLLTPFESAGLDNSTVDALVKAHLVRAETHGSSWYELAHDRLIVPVRSNNARWLDENLNEVQRQALTWARRGRPAELLFTGQSLARGALWAAGEKFITPDETAFLSACVQAERQAELEKDRRRTKRQLARRNLQLVVMILMVAAVSGLSLYAWRLFADSRRQEALSASREHAATAMNQLESNPTRALELAAQAAGLAPTPEAEAALHAVLAASRVRSVWSVPLKSGTAVAFSPDGRYLAFAGDSNETALVDARTRRSLTHLTGHQEEEVTSVAFSGDGRYVATGDTAGRLMLHTADAPYEHHVIVPGGDSINELAFSADGHMLAAATDAPGPLLWEINGAGAARQRPTERVEPASGPEKTLLFGVAFSPDGKFVVTGDSEGSVVLWDAAAPRLRVVRVIARLRDPLSGAAQAVLSVLFRPQSQQASATEVAVGTRSGAVSLWSFDAGSGRGAGRTLYTHADPILGLAFSRDGKYLASASHDKTARIWNLKAERELFRLKPSSGPMSGIAFDSSGELIATSSRSPSSSQELGTGIGAIVVWRVLFQDEVPQLSPGDLRGRILTANYVGSALVAVSDGDRGVRWGGNSQPVADAGCLHSGSGQVAAATFSPSGGHLICIGQQGEIAVIASAGGRVILSRRSGTITATYHSGPPLLATASREGQVEMWTLQRSGWVRKWLSQSPVPVRALAFSPAGDLLAEGRSDGITEILDVASGPTGGRSIELARHEGAVLSVAFSPDGKRIATGSTDQTAKLWDLARRVEVATFAGHWMPISGVAFTPDGEALATVDSAGIARIEPLSIDKLVKLARDRLRPLPSGAP